MPVIAGHLSDSGGGGFFNGRLSTALQALAIDNWPGHDAITAGIVVNAAELHFPVSATPNALTGYLTHAFSDDWYHRIHIRPQSLALGNVVSTEIETIEIWNAFLNAVTLSSIDGIEEGVSLAGPNTFPFQFQALELVTWDVSVTPDGPSSIDLTLTWNFAVVHDVSLPITGARVVAFAFTPNWATRIRERLSWETDVLGSPSGAEQRRAIRLSPRRRFEGDLVVDGRERGLFDNAIAGWGSQIWAMPIWPDVQVLEAVLNAGATSIACSTTGRDFRVGGLLLLRGTTAFLSEAAEIEAVGPSSITLQRPLQATWPAGTRLYPARTARLPEQPAITHKSDTVWTASFTFELQEPSDWAALTGLPTYRSHPVYALAPDESTGLGVSTERLIEVLDNLSGIPRVLDTAAQPFPVRVHRSVANGITERADLRSLFYTLNGRQVSIWLPTHADDFRLTVTVTAASTALSVENVGYARFGFNLIGRRDIRIELHSGVVFYRQILDASEIDADTEQLVIDSALGQTVNPADVGRISFMALVRSNSDEFQIEHETDVEGAAISEFELRALRDDLEAA